MKDKITLLLRQRLIVAVIVSLVLTSVGCQHNVVVESERDKREKITTMYQEYAQEFPLVPGMTVEKLQQLQRQGKNIVLVDVRSPKERKVSIIPRAITKAEFEANLEQYSSGSILVVAYCTIGYRSGKYAEKLRQQGIEILNLEGSILAWSHIQGKLVDAGGATNKVHVFGRQWELTADNYQPVW